MLTSLDGTLGLLLIVVGILLLILSISVRTASPIRTLLNVGVLISCAGSLAYLYLIGIYYGGGDYLLYWRGGLQYASILTEGDWARAQTEFWNSGRWWGTAFTIHMSGALLAVIGPTLAGAFLVFGLLGYGGTLCIWQAARRSFPTLDTKRYLLWLVLYPSLWFWPGALGKDAVVLLGIGLATLGLTERNGRTRWVLLALGLVAVFAIRPQVAATLAFALIAGHWLAAINQFSLVRAAQGVALLAGGSWVVLMAGGQMGVELFDSNAVSEYVEGRASVTQTGGGAIAGADEGVSPWLAPINTMFRPFPWEASGPTGLLASLEMLLLWGVALRRRREVRAFIRAYRHTPLIWMSLLFVLAYATALGMAIGNFGILTRQRVHILPFLLLFVVGPRKRALVRRVAPQHRRRLAPA